MSLNRKWKFLIVREDLTVHGTDDPEVAKLSASFDNCVVIAVGDATSVVSADEDDEGKPTVSFLPIPAVGDNT